MDGDLLVNLYHTGARMTAAEFTQKTGITLCRALSPDNERILSFIQQYYGEGWRGECGVALHNNPISCYLAVRDGALLGFSCYDATARGYFGPIAVRPDQKGLGIGEALTVLTLEGMREAGYGYAVIGWVTDARPFYEKILSVVPIPNSDPEKTIYCRMLRRVIA